MTADLSPASKALIATGRAAIGPTADQRARVRAAVSARLDAAAAAGATMGAAGQAGAASLSAGTGKILGIIAIASALAATAGFVAWQYRGAESPTATSQQAGELAPTEPAMEAGLLAPPEPPPGPDPEIAREPDNTRSSPTTRASRPSQGTSTLGLELALLDAARGALDANDADAALETIDRYFRETAARQLEREAILLRVRALCLTGRDVEADEAVARARWPSMSTSCSPLASDREAIEKPTN